MKELFIIENKWLKNHSDLIKQLRRLGYLVSCNMDTDRTGRGLPKTMCVILSVTV